MINRSSKNQKEEQQIQCVHTLKDLKGNSSSQEANDFKDVMKQRKRKAEEELTL